MHISTASISKIVIWKTLLLPFKFEATYGQCISVFKFDIFSHSKGQPGRWNGLSPNILSFLLFNIFATSIRRV